MSTLGERVARHEYPAAFRRHPGLLRLVRFAAWMLHPRIWRTRRLMRRMLSGLAAGDCWLDAGCGAGEHLLPLARRYPSIRAVGADLRASNVEMVRLAAARSGLDNVEAVQADISSAAWERRFDLVLLDSVLHYVPDDAGALRLLRDHLAPGGRIVLFSPVNGERVIPGYLRIRSRWFPSVDYDVVNTVERAYTEDALAATIRSADLEIAASTPLIGTCGKVAYEITSLSLLVVQRAPRLLAWVPALAFAIAIYPWVALLLLCDVVLPVRRPNAVLLVLAGTDGSKPTG